MEEGSKFISFCLERVQSQRLSGTSSAVLSPVSLVPGHFPLVPHAKQMKNRLSTYRKCCRCVKKSESLVWSTNVTDVQVGNNSLTLSPPPPRNIFTWFNYIRTRIWSHSTLRDICPTQKPLKAQVFDQSDYVLEQGLSNKNAPRNNVLNACWKASLDVHVTVRSVVSDWIHHL